MNEKLKRIWVPLNPPPLAKDVNDLTHTAEMIWNALVEKYRKSGALDKINPRQAGNK